MEKVQGGSLANLSGNSFEAFTEKVLLNLKINEDYLFSPKVYDVNEDILKNFGTERFKGASTFEEVYFKRELIKDFSLEKGNIILKHYPYLNIGDGFGKTEFALCNEFKVPLRIECRFQEVSGSVTEKVPNLFLSCREDEEVFLLIIFAGKDNLKRRNYIENVYRNMKVNSKQIKILFYENDVEKFEKDILEIVKEFWEI